ncbi:hypothetical protein CB0940_09464 [Cercospora beticola]|uniref:Uncharacterized protein n=1 Tax=Cercospora beticola TaxID=122368 RepID=A0A2G5HG04_CERBT|nr:hypothetical protein CB0940_09464 [Cercospora beticola]PIA91459.1 hypothetical protein CB0940_09464 [Cercospora beticola]WPB06220.1 hypothetical protein RHO25_010877 [Cercospora beticola]
MVEVDPEVLQAYREARARETAEALIRTDAKPDQAEQAQQILQDEGPKQAAELKKEDAAATSDSANMNEERRESTVENKLGLDQDRMK